MSWEEYYNAKICKCPILGDLLVSPLLFYLSPVYGLLENATLKKGEQFAQSYDCHLRLTLALDMLFLLAPPVAAYRNKIGSIGKKTDCALLILRGLFQA